MAQLVSDEVWRQLDPYAGQLPRRTVRHLRLAVLATVLLALVAGVLWRSGAIVPRVALADNAGYAWSTDAQTRRVEFSLTLRNYGWGTAEVLGAGRSGPGFVLVEVLGAFSTALEPGAEMELAIVYQVTDCAAVPDGLWPVPVRVSRPWGVYTAYVMPPHLTSPDAPGGMRSYTGRDPYAREWQQVLADVACNPR